MSSWIYTTGSYPILSIQKKKIGGPVGYVKSIRGLGLGDHLSPCLSVREMIFYFYFFKDKF